MMQPGNAPNRKYVGAAIAVAVIFATALVIELVGRRQPEPAQPKFAIAHPGLVGLDPDSSLTEPPDGGGDDIRPVDESARAEEDATVAGFLKLLGSSSPEPKSRAMRLALTEEFKNAPALRKAHEEFLKLPPEKRKPREFLARVGKTPEFHRLVARFMSSPGIGGMLPAFAGAKPRNINEIVRDWKAKGTSGVDVNKASARAELRPVLPGGGAASSRFGAGGGGSGAIQSAGAHAFGGVGQHAGAGAHGSLAPIPQPREAADGGGGRGKGAGGGGPAAAAGSEASRDILPVKLKPVPIVQGDDWRDPGARRKLIEAFLIKMDPAKRAAIQALLEAGTENLWSACFMTGNFSECLRVCRDPEVNCSAKNIPVPASAWDACNHREGQDPSYHTPNECVVLCVDRRATGCYADESVRLSGCKVTSVPCAYCNNRQYGTKIVNVGNPSVPTEVPRYANEVCSPINDGTGPAAPPVAAAAGPDTGKPPAAAATTAGEWDSEIKGEWDWGQFMNYNDLRHAYIMGGDTQPKDFDKAMANANVILRHEPGNDYILNTLANWKRGENPAAAANELQLLAEKYKTQAPYLAAAALLEAAKLRANMNSDPRSALAILEDAARRLNDPKLEAYKKLADQAVKDAKASKPDPKADANTDPRTDSNADTDAPWPE